MSFRNQQPAPIPDPDEFRPAIHSNNNGPSFEDEAASIERAARAGGFAADAPLRPKLRRRLIDEAQDTFTTLTRRSLLDKFDLWCATEGLTKKAGFEEMIRRVTRRM